MRAVRHCRWIVAVGALALAAPAWADFESDYVAGLAALDHGAYAQAASYLKKALDAQPDPVRSVTINGNPQPYLPHHFLGMAAYHQGDCALARSEWDNQMNRRMLGRLHTLKREEDGLIAKCQPAKVAAQTTPTTTPTTPDKTKANTSPAVPPSALIDAFDDYVAGQYTKASRIDPQSIADTRLRFQAYLLRAAARFALSRFGGGSSALGGARSDARAAQALDQSSPNPRVFSPAFRAFYTGAK